MKNNSANNDTNHPVDISQNFKSKISDEKPIYLYIFERRSRQFYEANRKWIPVCNNKGCKLQRRNMFLR